MRLAQVGDVEALDPHGDRLHAQRLLEAVEGLDALGAPALGAQPVLVERQAGVALGQLEDAPLVAALGVADLDRAAAALGQQLADGVRVVEPARHDHLRRDRHRAGVVLEQELLGHLGLVAPGLVLEVEALAVGQDAVAHLEDLRVGVGVLHRHRDRVHRAHRLVGHALALQQRPDRLQLVAEARGLLELLLRPPPPACRAPARARSRGSGRTGSRRWSRRCAGTPRPRRSPRRAPGSA